MSVVQYSHGYFDQLYTDLLHAKGDFAPFFSLSRLESLEYQTSKYLQELGTEEQYRRTMLSWWLDRLFIANQMAVCYEYQSMRGESKETSARFLAMLKSELEGYEIAEAERGNSPYLYFFPQPRAWQEGSRRSIRETASDLRMLDYNLSANSGARFISKEDEERLHAITSAIESEIADVHGFHNKASV